MMALNHGTRKSLLDIPFVEKEKKMDVITSLIQYMKLRRVQSKQNRQKRTVLHMLAASGVVRPGHIELRYTKPFARSTARRA